MRIDRVRIENLASLRGEQTLIDLEEGELRDAGLIAITGATGAGKSTILDAVCLALFDQTPRLQGRGRDPRELLSRGAGEAKAVVDLTLDDDRRWTAEWTVHRARGRADGALQASRQRILDRTTGEVLADQKRAVREMVEGKLGLSFEQFTGVILLAQGQFAKFLESTDADRSELLERLTGTEIYSRLGTLAFERHKELRQKVETEEERLRELVVLAEPERRRMEQEQDELEPHLARIEEQLHGLELQGRRLQDRRRLSERRDGAVQALKEAESRLERAEPERRRLRLAEAAGAQAAALHRLDDARAAARDAETVLATAEEEGRSVEAAARTARLRLRTLLDRLRGAVGPAREAVDRLKGFAAADAERLGDLRDARRDAGDARKRLDDLHRRGVEAEQGLELRAKEVADARAAVEAVGTETEGLRERLDEASARRARVLGGASPERLNADLERLRQASEVRSELDDLDPETLEEQVAGLAVELQRADADTAAARALAESARRERDEHEKLVQLAIEGAKVAAHRHLLREGEPCPLCGSEIHPFVDGHDPHEEALPEDERAVLRRAHDRRDALRAEVRRTEAQLEESQQQRQKVADDLARRQERAHETRRAFEQRGSRWLELRMRLVDLPADPFAVTGRDLGRMLSGLEERLETLKAMTDEEEALRERVREAEDRRRDARGRLELAEERRRHAEGRKADAARARTEAETAMADAETLLGDRARALAEACGLELEDVGENAADDPLGAFYDRLYERLVEGRRSWQRADERARRLEDLERSVAERGTRLLADDAWTEELPDDAAETDAGTEDDPEDDLGDDLRRALDRVDEQLGRRRLADDRLGRARSAVDSARAARDARVQELGRELEDSPFDDEDALRQALLPPTELDRLRRELEELRLAVEARRAEHRRSIEDLEEHDAESAELGLPAEPDGDLDALAERLEQQTRDVRARRKELADRSMGLRLELEKDQEKRRERSRLDQRLEESIAARDRSARLAQLIGQKDGGKFRRFAQQLNLSRLLGLANRRLEHLAPRYALASLPDSLDLEVIDREMADERRPVSTLSGGESFLASLALALALADLRRGRLRLGTLFLDEGFGSLDQETLDTALSTLEQLQADQATQILVISHVGALQERIPHRIEVEKRGGGRSRLKIRVGDS